jgi:hypothetical protein
VCSADPARRASADAEPSRKERGHRGEAAPPKPTGLRVSRSGFLKRPGTASICVRHSGLSFCSRRSCASRSNPHPVGDLCPLSCPLGDVAAWPSSSASSEDRPGRRRRGVRAAGGGRRARRRGRSSRGDSCCVTAGSTNVGWAWRARPCDLSRAIHHDRTSPDRASLACKAPDLASGRSLETGWFRLNPAGFGPGNGSLGHGHSRWCAPVHPSYGLCLVPNVMLWVYCPPAAVASTQARPPGAFPPLRAALQRKPSPRRSCSR